MDIQIDNFCGSIALLRPHTSAGRSFLEETTDPDATWFGGALVVEPRYVAPIVEGAQAEGLEVSS